MGENTILQAEAIKILVIYLIFNFIINDIKTEIKFNKIIFWFKKKDAAFKSDYFFNKLLRINLQTNFTLYQNKKLWNQIIITHIVSLQ